MITAEVLHERFKEFPKVSRLLVMKYSKLDFESSCELHKEISILRKNAGLDQPRKKWSRIK